ncbi:LysR family transcriptional regulator [Mangrovibacter sp. MFB070]|uniref:LysR family transcriptional regulator n=1 Tax=Mangrovibacter sp. MFB070 TaxID=1224318 RepID=UPI0004D4773E|nr:LysR family transcriptional regulator [Mangrovibacter sp. MFB070]KEA50976.1 LysR family transcriptional regulator [Mangrovibacter sp. MFB070]
MAYDLNDLQAVVAVARAGGFREAARNLNTNPSRLSDAVRRAEQQLGVRLFNRTTRTVALTEAGRALVENLRPALDEVETALDKINGFRHTPRGTLRLNVPVSAARLILPDIIPAFLARYPEIDVDIIAESNLVDIFSAGCDAGIRYEESLAQDMIAVPFGPRTQRFAVVASPEYLAFAGQPEHPTQLMQHRCIRCRYHSGVISDWEFHKGDETVRVQVKGPLVVSIGAAVDLAVDAAIKGAGIIMLFEDWLAPAIARGELKPVLEPWWPEFSGPWLYYPDRRLVPAPLRAFIDFIHELNAYERESGKHDTGTLSG